MAFARRYYPGFLGALFLVALRMCIGWHFFHEAQHKIESREGERPFSAEAYLRNATGPLAVKFRAMVPDVDSLGLLDPSRVETGWEADLGRLADHFQFDEAQRGQARELLEASTAEAEAWFGDPENERKISEYREALADLTAARDQSQPMAYETERLATKRTELEGTRQELIAPIEGFGEQLRADLVALATPDQREAVGAYEPPRGEMERLNTLVMYGMLACGLGLMLGLLTPLSALGAAGFLAMFYLSMPPWPGLPENPQAEGNYLFVNKNLIELLACLLIAVTPSGMWVGLDALLFGWIGRRSAARRAAEAEPEPQRA